MRGTYCGQGAHIVDGGHLLLNKWALIVDKGVSIVNKGHLLYTRGTYRIFLCENKIVPFN